VTDKPIYDWPLEWYKFTSATFRLQSRSQVTPRTFTGGKTVLGPHSQLWVSQLAFNPNERWDDDGQAVSAFFSRLEGQAGLIRIGHVARITAQLNRLTAATPEQFSDGTGFTDGTSIVVKPVPPVCTLAAAASRGDNYIVLGSLPASQSKLLRKGDLIELRPNGVWSRMPSLHEVMVPGSTDADGKTGVEIRPRLSQGYAFGDMAVLDDARAIFKLVDDDQGVPIINPPDFASLSFNLEQWVP
jgi:hypothetical protein